MLAINYSMILECQLVLSNVAMIANKHKLTEKAPEVCFLTHYLFSLAKMP